MRELQNKDVLTISGGYTDYYYYDTYYYVRTPEECFVEGAIIGGITGIFVNAAVGNHLGDSLAGWVLGGGLVNVILS